MQNFNPHGLPCTSCFSSLEMRCPQNAFALLSTSRILHHRPGSCLSCDKEAVCILRREAQIKMNMVTSLQNVCSTSFRRLHKSRNTRILNPAFALAYFSLSELVGSVSLFLKKYLGEIPCSGWFTIQITLYKSRIIVLFHFFLH